VLNVGAVVHSIDSWALAQKLCATINQDALLKRPYPVLMQVRLSDDTQRPGVAEGDALALGEALLGLDALDIRGVMGVPPAGVDPKPYFARLWALSQALQQKPGGHRARAISMGMSEDFRAAILEGATIVRVGSALFGPRTQDPGENAHGLDPD